MPAAKDPQLREFYVYTLVVEGVPFYVGIGRGKRAGDRMRYVRYLMAREVAGKVVKWSLSTSTIAGLLQAGYEIEIEYVVRDRTRAEALTLETAEIRRLLADGVTLANIQHNTARLRDAKTIVDTILRRLEAS